MPSVSPVLLDTQKNREKREGRGEMGRIKEKRNEKEVKQEREEKEEEGKKRSSWKEGSNISSVYN